MAVADGVRGVVAENILDDFVCPSLVGKRVTLPAMQSTLSIVNQSSSTKIYLQKMANFLISFLNIVANLLVFF